MWICVRFAHLLDCWGDAMVTNLWQCDNGGHLVTGPWASWCHEGGGIIGNIYFETRTFYCVLWSHHHTMLTPESWGGINGQGWHNGWGLDGGQYSSVMDPCSLCLAPRWRNINKADTMDTIHPLAPILGVNGFTGAGFQQAPYKYKLTTLTDISPCSLHLFKH